MSNLLKNLLDLMDRKFIIISYFGQVCRNTLYTMQKFKEFEYYHHETA